MLLSLIAAYFMPSSLISIFAFLFMPLFRRLLFSDAAAPLPLPL